LSWVSGEAEYFFKRGWTGKWSICPSGVVGQITRGRVLFGADQLVALRHRHCCRAGLCCAQEPGSANPVDGNFAAAGLPLYGHLFSSRHMRFVNITFVPRYMSRLLS
jgi:hypothetical protein